VPIATACDCEGAVLLERQLLQAEHTKSVHALMKTYVTRIDLLEGLVAALRVNADAVTRDVAPDPAPRALPEPKLPGTPTGPAGELRKSAPSRTLLQTDSDKFCSMDELMSVQQNALAAVTGILATNADCAMCLFPCGSAENVLGCAMACVKQVPRNTRNQERHCTATRNGCDMRCPCLIACGFYEGYRPHLMQHARLMLGCQDTCVP
jgi:hypothetical protein